MFATHDLILHTSSVYLTTIPHSQTIATKLADDGAVAVFGLHLGEAILAAVDVVDKAFAHTFGQGAAAETIVAVGMEY